MSDATLTDKPEQAGFSATLRVLRPGPFRRYMIGESISTTGTWMQMMAQGYVMTTLTDSAFMLGVLGLVGGLPGLALTMVGGSFADKHDKRLILQVCQVVQIVLALATGWLVLQHQIALWHVFCFAAVLGAVNAFEMPAVSALVPELVEPDEIKDAIAVDRSVFHLTRLIGPAVAGGLVAAWGAASAFFINASTFVALMVSLATLPARPPVDAEEEAARSSGMGEGFRYVKGDAPTVAMLGLTMLMAVFVFPLIGVMMPIYATKLLQAGPGGMGLLMAVSGAGSLAGSIGLLAVPREKRRSRLAIASAAVALSLLGLAAATHVTLAAIGLGIMAVGMSTLFGIGNTIIQERAPGHLRGRVSAIAGLAFFGLMPFTGLVSTGLADLIGMRTELFASAVVFAIGSFLVLAGPIGKTIGAPLPSADEERPAPVA